MERINLFKKRMMVYPERLNIDQIMPNKRQVTATSSWCSGDLQIVNNPSQQNDGIAFNRSVRPAGTELIHQHRTKLCATQSCSASIEHPPSDDDQLFVRQRLRHLVRAFTERAQRMRKRLEMPPTPSTISSGTGDDIVQPHPAPVYRRVSTSQSDSNNRITYSSNCITEEYERSTWQKLFRFENNRVLDPQSYVYIGWLFTVTLAYLYNCWVIPLRASFPYQTPENVKIWWCFDYICDAIYLLDVLIFQPRVMYLNEGFWIRDPALTRLNYIKKCQFKIDIISLVPLDLLYFYFGSNKIILRFPRMLKLHTFKQFFIHWDRILSSPHIVRVTRTLSYMLYLIHINACAYYAFSAWEGLNKNNWTYNNRGNAYIRCFYFATKTATSIGKNLKPENEHEYMFMTASWLMGVFVFALLIGQIRDIIATATRSQTEYCKLVDDTLEYLRRLKMPEDIQRRVKMWFTFTWETQHSLDENRILDCLPHKMKTDVAINVHINTLSKVSLFSDCDEALLRELVLKLRSMMYLPTDIICRKGEVGREMYILKSGKVQVVADNGEVLATLQEGSVFGEISLLNLNGVNRRTADVRSLGYSNLFVLSKSDLNDAIVHYPDAQEVLKKKAKMLMLKNAQREKSYEDGSANIVIKNPVTPVETPKLVHTVMQAVPEESGTGKLLRYGSKFRRSTRKSMKQQMKEETVNVISVDIDKTMSFGDSSSDDKKNEFNRKFNECIASIENQKIISECNINDCCGTNRYDSFKTKKADNVSENDDNFNMFSSEKLVNTNDLSSTKDEDDNEELFNKNADKNNLRPKQTKNCH